MKSLLLLISLLSSGFAQCAGVGELNGGDVLRFPSGFALQKTPAPAAGCAFLTSESHEDEIRLGEALDWKVDSFPKLTGSSP